MSRPVVLVVSRRTTRGIRLIDYVAEAHLTLLIRLGVLPMIVPVVAGTQACLPQYSEQMRGLLLVEGEDIEPGRYPAAPANFRYLEKTHALKDEIETRLLQQALSRRVPILGICRGSQLLNVVSGGTLYGDIQKEKKSPLKHIDVENYDTHRHLISIKPGTPLARWFRRRSLPVNSYHHQGIRKLAKRFEPMAHTEDGLIEAYYDPRVQFVVGVQFHPERMAEAKAANLRLWTDFAAAVKQEKD